MNNGWRSFAEETIKCAKKEGVTYADVRIYPFNRQEEIEVENGNVVNVSTGTTSGFGVRVLYNGAWGLYATDNLEAKYIPGIVERAISNARANARTRKHPVELLPLREEEKGCNYYYVSPYAINPFFVQLDEKVRLLLMADKAMAEAGKRIFLRQGSLSSYQFRKILLTSDDIFADQTFTRVGTAITAMAQRNESDPDK